jgi:hypothetical protein
VPPLLSVVHTAPTCVVLVPDAAVPVFNWKARPVVAAKSAMSLPTYFLGPVVAGRVTMRVMVGVRGVDSLAERFWAKVDTTGECWEWLAQRATNGYGQMRVKKAGKWSYDRAHRVSYALNIAPIPDGLCVLHRCDNRGCVRPEHLWLGTYQDNLRDMAAKGRAGYVVHPESINKGSRNGWAVLTEENVREIRRRYAVGGITMETIGRDYGVTKHAVWGAIRKGWRHVT